MSPNAHTHDHLSQLLRITDELSGWCDADFDTAFDDLEREFAELRMHLNH